MSDSRRKGTHTSIPPRSSSARAPQRSLDPEVTDSVVLGAFHGASVGMCLVDLRGRIHKANDMFQRMVGYSEEELCEMGFSDFTHPEDRQQNLDLFTQLISGKRAAYTLEKRYIHRSGNVWWGRVNTAVVRQRSGRLQFILATIEDIEAERARQRRVDEMEEELARVRRLEAMGRALAGVAHDFNTILHVARNYAEMIREDLSREHRVKREVDALIASVNRGADLVADLLAFASEEATEREKVDINSVVRDAWPMLVELPGERIQMRRTLAPAVPDVMANHDALTRVLINLVSNARNAMPDGGDVVISTGVIEDDDKNVWVVLEVRDTGIGMDDETMDRMWEPFFTTHKRKGGTGLGLATVYGLVRGMDGSIDVHSMPGQGSRFTVKLPLGSADEALARAR